MSKIYNGIIDDPRSKSEKSKDWKAEELVSAPVVEWKEKKKWKSYTERNQKSTSSCVAQSIAKMLEILNHNETGKTVVFSASPIYARRANRPYEGMWMQDALKITKDFGTTLESRIKSQFLNTDKEMEEAAEAWDYEDFQIAQTYGIEAYAEITDITMDTLAGHLQAGRPVLIFLYADSNEYKEFPTIKNKELKKENAPIRHGTALTENGLIKGKKVLRLEDSAHFGKYSVRFIDEDFLSKRVYAAGVLFDRDNSVLPKKIKHTFSSPMELGQTSKDIKVLQDILKVEDCFPVVAKSTGYYGEITRQGVEKFQAKYQVASMWELIAVKGKRVGAKTIAKLNELYGK